MLVIYPTATEGTERLQPSSRAAAMAAVLRLALLQQLLLSPTWSATPPLAAIDLSVCGSSATAQCWTASSEDGVPGLVDGHGRVSTNAMVPGEVHDDLMRGGVLGDLWHGNGSALVNAAWVGWRSWTFHRTFPTPAVAVPHAVDGAAAPAWRRWLHFDGVEYNCTVTLNNVTLGQHVGQMAPFEYDVTELLHAGGDLNQLEVTTHPFLDNSTLFSEQVKSVSYTGQVSCWLNRHAPQFIGRTFYGWDFVPAVFTAGIWRQVSLRTTAALPAAAATAGPATVRAPDLSVIPRLTPPYSTATLELSLEISLGGGAVPAGTELAVHWNVSAPEGAQPASMVSSHAVSTADHQPIIFRVKLSLPQPALWWPNGYGDQPIYHATASVLAGSVALDSVSASFGVG